MSWGYAPYVSVAARRLKAEKASAKARKAGADFSPIAAYSGAMAKTFWGKAWADNLESYSDYANRLPRGRTYTRNGSVIDLKIVAGEVHAQVMGSSLYSVKVTVAKVPDKQWQALLAQCAGAIDSVVELLQGRLSQAVMERICKPGTGLFPAPREIAFSCSCPDSASMCKHVAAALYGVGARLDQQPELLFSLRRVDAAELIRKAASALPKAGPIPAAGKRLDDTGLADLFGIEMAEVLGSPASKLKPKPSPVQARTAAPVKVVKAVKIAKTAKALKLPAKTVKASPQPQPADKPPVARMRAANRARLATPAKSKP